MSGWSKVHQVGARYVMAEDIAWEGEDKNYQLQSKFAKEILLSEMSKDNGIYFWPIVSAGKLSFDSHMTQL